MSTSDTLATDGEGTFMGTLIIGQVEKDFLLQCARERAPREACGVIIGDEFIEVHNISPTDSFFEMDPHQLLELYEIHGGVDGVWHSHPQGNPHPSSTDMDMHPRGKRMIIVTLEDVHDHGIIA
jgi:proteasome lid subunit RPN8/RPN11